MVHKEPLERSRKANPNCHLEAILRRNLSQTAAEVEGTCHKSPVSRLKSNLDVPGIETGAMESGRAQPQKPFQRKTEKEREWRMEVRTERSGGQTRCVAETTQGKSWPRSRRRSARARPSARPLQPLEPICGNGLENDVTAAHPRQS